MSQGGDFSRAEDVSKQDGSLAPAGSLSGQRILIARAAIARDVIPDALRAAGAIVDVARSLSQRNARSGRPNFYATRWSRELTPSLLPALQA